jgi:hypothetical protein
MVLRGNVPVKFLTIGIFFNRGDIILDGIYSHYVSFSVLVLSLLMQVAFFTVR